MDADVDSPFCYAVTNGLTEQAIRDSGCGFSIVRASIFTEFFRHFLLPARTTGQLSVPAGDGRIGLKTPGGCTPTPACSPPSTNSAGVTAEVQHLTGRDPRHLGEILDETTRSADARWPGIEKRVPKVQLTDAHGQLSRPVRRAGGRPAKQAGGT